MSVKQRAFLGALLLFGGLLVAFGAGVTKSNNRIKYEMDLEKQKPDPRVPDNGAANVALGLGILISAAGPFLLASALRDMTQQIGEAQSSAELKMRLAVEEKRDPKPKAGA
jgi:hypothetical protein